MAAKLRQRRGGPAVPKLLGRIHAFSKHVGTPSGTGPRVRNADGDSPTISRNVRLKVAKLVKPTSRQISLTESSVVRSRLIARSMRRRCR